VSFSGLVVKAVVPMAVLATLAVARRHLPSRSPDTVNQIPAAEAARFESYPWIFVPLMVLFGGAFCWITHALLVGANRWYSFRTSAEGIRLWPQSAIWWFFPALGALCLANEFVLQVWGAIGDRDTAELYARWSDEKTGYKARKLLLWMALLIALPIGFLTVLEIPVHATLRENEIVSCHYAFLGCESFSYSDARRITLVRGFRLKNGSIQQRAGIVIDFGDGRRWNSGDFGNFSRTVDPGLMEFLVAKTALPLGRAETDADIGK
jgi:hypothetical protein